MKVAIIHYWLVSMRGGEKVIESLCELFPQADIYTHVYNPDNISDIIKQHKIQTTFISKLPFAKRYYKTYFPLMPVALEQLDLRDYDLIISSESGPAKGIITSPTSLHISYVHTPMRYLWDMYPDYRKSAGFLKRLLMPPIMHYLRMWDVSTASRIDAFITNSHYVKQRVKKYYRRAATVIHPPVEIDKFQISDKTEDFYLMVGQLVRYKKTEVAVEAFNRMKKKLVIIGEGEHFSEIRKIAGDNILLKNRQPFEIIKEYYSKCKALIFPGIEDFGIVPVEAMASGRPVIAFGKGGALETVVEGVTGMFFKEQTPECLIETVEKFETNINDFNSEQIRTYAKKFSKEIFQNKMNGFINKAISEQQSANENLS